MYKSAGMDMCDADATFKKNCCATCSKASAGLEEAVGTKICKQDGKDSGVCDERKYLPASDACDNCKRGRRWVGWGGFGNHWCCTAEDARNNDDCSCWHVRYHAEVDAAVETSEETEVGGSAVEVSEETEVGADAITAMKITEETKNYVLMEVGQCSTPWIKTYHRGHINHEYSVETVKKECGGKMPAGYMRWDNAYSTKYSRISLCCATPCECSGYKNENGRGGPNCNSAGNPADKPWCYIKDDAECNDKVGATGRKWSEEACKSVTTRPPRRRGRLSLEEAVGQRATFREDASMQFAVQNEAVKTTDVAVYGLAFIGFGVVVFGAYKHYTGGKTHGDHVQIL
jgi:hypothetical protein